ncbi:hypothetical protein K1719_021802 [Acacia pycnantha]|nr:hypothetical protein K1719_021802 [Acacia pycnantha]
MSNGVGNGEDGSESFKRGMRDLEELLSKLNPMAEEFVPPSLTNHHGFFGHAGLSYPNNFIPHINYGNANRHTNRRRKNGYNQGKRRANNKMDVEKREEMIKKTVYVSDIDQHVTEEQLAALILKGVLVGWTKNDEDDETEDYGSGTDFAKVLNPNDGISVDFSNPLCPKFELEEKEKERLMKPFRRTLIVKLLGRQLSYGFMVKKLRMLWERKGSIDVFDLENEFFLINFQHQDDYMGALIGGPWVIADAYLNVARW